MCHLDSPQSSLSMWVSVQHSVVHLVVAFLTCSSFWDFPHCMDLDIREKWGSGSMEPASGWACLTLSLWLDWDCSFRRGWFQIYLLCLSSHVQGTCWQHDRALMIPSAYFDGSERRFAQSISIVKCLEMEGKIGYDCNKTQSTFTLLTSMVSKPTWPQDVTINLCMEERDALTSSISGHVRIKSTMLKIFGNN